MEAPKSTQNLEAAQILDDVCECPEPIFSNDLFDI
jgi:hypothetical protein